MAIRTVRDLFAAGAAWVAESFYRGASRARSLLGALRGKFGAEMEATAPTVANFGRRVQAAQRAAVELSSGGIVTPDMPGAVPGAVFPTEYQYHAVVKVEIKDYYEPGRPYRASVPVIVPADKIYDLDDLETIALGHARTKAGDDPAYDRFRYALGIGAEQHYSVVITGVYRSA